MAVISLPWWQRLLVPALTIVLLGGALQELLVAGNVVAAVILGGIAIWGLVLTIRIELRLRRAQA